MSISFAPAKKSQAFLRLAVSGPSGSGKTMTSLRLATGLARRTKAPIGVIDTERGSASKYADRFDFVVAELPDWRVDTYVAAMKAAADAGVGVLIIDSATHAWQEILDFVDKQKQVMRNDFMAWSKGTPIYRDFIDAILGFPGDVIVTMRAKTHYDQEKDERGKLKPVKVGLAPEMRQGFEYEFDMLIEINQEHIATVSKDRTGKFQDAVITKPGEEMGEAMAAWLLDAPPATPAATVTPKRPEPATEPEPAPDVDAYRAWVKEQASYILVDGIKMPAHKLHDLLGATFCSDCGDAGKSAKLREMFADTKGRIVLRTAAGRIAQMYRQPATVAADADPNADPDVE